MPHLRILRFRSAVATTARRCSKRHGRVRDPASTGRTPTATSSPLVCFLSFPSLHNPPLFLMRRYVTEQRDNNRSERPRRVRRYILRVKSRDIRADIRNCSTLSFSLSCIFSPFLEKFYRDLFFSSVDAIYHTVHDDRPIFFYFFPLSLSYCSSLPLPPPSPLYARLGVFAFREVFTCI